MRLRRVCASSVRRSVDTSPCGGLARACSLRPRSGPPSPCICSVVSFSGYAGRLHCGVVGYLVEHLAGEQEAHGTPRSRPSRLGRRQSRDGTVRGADSHGTNEGADVPRARHIAAEELEALAAELEDDELTLVPVSAVMCRRLLTDLVESPLLNPALPPEELRSRLTSDSSRLRREPVAA